MSRISAKVLLDNAVENKYAIGYFECWDLESTLAVVRAAEIAKSPVMIGVCGTYIGEAKRKYKESLTVYYNMLSQVAEEATVPVCLLLNESDDEKMVYQAIKSGFDMVMFAPVFASEALPIDEQIEIQKRVVRYAHACNVAVEAEVGELPMVNSATGDAHEGYSTDPEFASQFVKNTGIDALAVSVGNCHLMEHGKATLDIDLLQAIGDKTNVPLVLHGGTGIDLNNFKDAIKVGVAKVNVGTALKRAVMNAQRKYYNDHNVDNLDPNDVFGRGCELDLGIIQQEAIMEIVLDYIKAFNGQNKAF